MEPADVERVRAEQPGQERDDRRLAVQRRARDLAVTVDQAAERLGVSTDWLFRRSRTLPFVVRLGRHLRFSNRGIDRYLRNRTGR